MIEFTEKPTVVAIAGLTEKSTYIKENLKGFKILNFDNFILEIFGKDDYDYAYYRYSDLLQSEKDIIYMHSKIYYRELLLKGENIVIDYTNLTKEWLDNWLDIVPASYRKVGVIFKKDLGGNLDMREIFREEINYTEYFDSVSIFE